MRIGPGAGSGEDEVVVANVWSNGATEVSIELREIAGMSKYVNEWQIVAANTERELFAQADRLSPHATAGSDRRLEQLTHREWEVLCLLVARCSDREIAERLFISYRTVTSHVTNIFNKLGVSSRRDAAALATRGYPSSLSTTTAHTDPLTFA